MTSVREFMSHPTHRAMAMGVFSGGMSVVRTRADPWAYAQSSLSVFAISWNVQTGVLLTQGVFQSHSSMGGEKMTGKNTASCFLQDLMAVAALRQFMSDPLSRAMSLSLFSGTAAAIEQRYVPQRGLNEGIQFSSRSLVSFGVISGHYALTHNLVSIPVWVGMTTAYTASTLYYKRRPFDWVMGR